MKLYYRGLSYEYDPNKIENRKTGQPFQPVCESRPPYTMMYRGVSYRVAPDAKSAEVSLTPVAYKLSYRGISYLVNRTVQGEITVIMQPSSTPSIVAGWN